MKILQKLKKYFEDNSEEQILADWEKTKNSDCIDAPTVDEFLLCGVVRCVCKMPEPRLKVSENGTHAYCNNCAKTYLQK